MTNHDEELLTELLLQWEELYERGEDSSPEELCRDCPHLLDELRGRIAAMKATDWLNNPDCDEDALIPANHQTAGKVLLGRYRLDTLIATGGFAEVWRAFDTELQRIVAIKLPKPSRLASSTSFITEARRVARLKHPGIVPVFDVGTEDGRCFIVSEYVEGGSLADRLAKSPPAVSETVRWLGEIATALEYAHLHGVIHRDIKPANILIDHHGRALLADFGIAQSAQKTGTFAPSLGTLRYMSPEQLEGKAATPHSDVYSLGVVLHECLTGELPYSSNDPSVLRKEIVEGSTIFKSGVPVTLQDVCKKAVRRLPHERHSSAAHFASDVERAIEAVPVKKEAGSHLLRGVVPVAVGALVLLLAPLFLPAASRTSRPVKPSHRPSAASAPGGLVLHWRFDEDSSQKVTDVSSAHNDGVTNGATWQPEGRNGGCMSFDGYDDYIDAGSDTSLAMKHGELTFAAWVRPRQGGRLVCRRKGEPRDFICEITPTNAGFGYFDAAYMPYQDPKQGFSVPIQLTDGWHHVAWVVNAREQTFYLDGLLIEKKSLPYRLPVHDDFPVWIGADPALEMPNPYTYGGLIDDVMLWNRPLSAAEIAGLVTEPLPTFENSVGMKLVEVPAGEFLMGAGYGHPSNPHGHLVLITRPFLIATTEVTNAQWNEVMGDIPSDFRDGDLPVNHVSWDDAVEFCRRLSELPSERTARRAYRLPTEAEWEYACRAGTSSRHSFGDEDSQIHAYAWLFATSSGRTHPVASKKPNQWGLYDMRGNVWEWASDLFHDPSGKDESVAIDPKGPSRSPQAQRVVRGGCWNDNPDSFGTGTEQDTRSRYTGFRVAADIVADAP